MICSVFIIAIFFTSCLADESPVYVPPESNHRLEPTSNIHQPAFDNEPAESVVTNTAYAHVPQYGYASVPSYTLQPGYQGVVVPSTALKPHGLAHLSYIVLKKLTKVPSLAKKLGTWAVGVSVLFIIGAALTASICTFTPLCHISIFGYDFAQQSFRSLMTTDNLNALTNFVHDAIEKYQQTEFESNEVPNTH